VTTPPLLLAALPSADETPVPGVVVASAPKPRLDETPEPNWIAGVLGTISGGPLCI